MDFARTPNEFGRLADVRFQNAIATEAHIRSTLEPTHRLLAKDVNTIYTSPPASLLAASNGTGVARPLSPQGLRRAPPALGRASLAESRRLRQEIETLRHRVAAAQPRQPTPAELAAAHRQKRGIAPLSFARPAAPAPKPLQPYEPYQTGREGWRYEHISDRVFEMARAFGIPDRQATGLARIPENLVDVLPIAGDVVGAEETYRDLKSGNYLSGGIGGLATVVGLFPGAGDLAAKGIRKGGKFLTDFLGSPSSLTAETGSTLDRKILHSIPNRPVGQSADMSDFTDDEIGFDLPPVPPRSAREQYGDTPPEIGPDGILKTDLDGNPLVAPPDRIVGLSDLGTDKPIEPVDTEYLAWDLLGRPIERVPGTHSELWNPDSPAVGKTKVGARRTPRRILVNESLTPHQTALVDAHEVSHAIDLLAGKIPIDGIEDDLKSIYHQLAVGRPPFSGEAAHTPREAGYAATDERFEYVAEAIRAYFRTPEALKEKYPEVARRIRQNVNENLNLNRYVQFNAQLAAPVLGAGVGGVALGGGDEKDEELFY